MSKIAIAVCGSAGLDHIEPSHDFYTFRSIIVINGQEYIDYEEIKAEKVYHMMAYENAEVHTAQTPTGTLVNLLEKIRDDGYDEVLMIIISSGLSGTCNGIYTATSMVEGIKVHPFDSLFIGFPLAHMAYTARRMIKEGKKIEEVIKTLENIRDSLVLYAVIDNVKYLVQNGRLSLAKGVFATLLNIKPMITNTKLGGLAVYKKVRAKRKANLTMIDDFLEAIRGKTAIIPFFLYSNNYEEVAQLRELLYSKTKQFENIGIYPLPPVIGIHVGPGALALGYIREE